MITFAGTDIFLVTGASSGIGQGVAVLFNQLGATVIASGRNTQGLNELKKISKNPDLLHLEAQNLSENIDQLPDWILYLKKKYGKLKGLIHCAGITKTAPLSMFDHNEALSLFAIDYFAPVMLAKCMADRRINIGAGASMTFIASLAAERPEKGQGLYAGAKAALVKTMEVVGKELAPRHIRVNCISPALIMTPMAEQFLQELDPAGTQKNYYPMGLGATDDVASLCAFLASDKARWITGQNYILDGGLTK